MAYRDQLIALVRSGRSGQAQELCTMLGIRLDLHGADLRDSNLYNAKLHRANLRGADLHDANLSGANLSEAKHDEKTIWPDGFDITSSW